MKKKNIINKLIVAPLVMGFMSCTGNYMDINSNPYQMSIRHSLLIVCWVDRWEVILPIQMPAGPIQYPILMLQMTGRVCS